MPRSCCRPMRRPDMQTVPPSGTPWKPWKTSGNELAVGKDHQFKGRYEAEKNAVIISLEKDEREW